MFTVKQIFKELGIPKSTLYRYIRQNKLRVIRNPFGHGLVVHEAEELKLRQLAAIYQAKRKRGEGV